MQNIDEAAYVVISNDQTSKKIKIDKNTNLGTFYQLIINVFPPSDDCNMKLFYYEGYSHEKNYISDEKDYVTANKKGIEYFYLCSNESNNGEYIDYLKYYSVIIFSPIKRLNSEYQNEQRKQMKLEKIKINKINNINNNNVISNSNIMNNNFMNPMNINPMMMNPMNINPMMMNPMMINPMNMMNPFNPNNMNNMMNPFMINNMINQFYNLYSANPMMGNDMIGQLNPNMLKQCLQILEESEQDKNINYQIEKEIPEYETIDTEANPINKYIENAINMSYTMKLEILKQKQLHPEKFINIATTLSSPGLLSLLQPSIEDYKYILCLIGKIL